MGVRVDAAGHQQLSACVDDLGVARLQARADFGDLLPLDAQVGLFTAAYGLQLPTLDQNRHTRPL